MGRPTPPHPTRYCEEWDVRRSERVRAEYEASKAEREEKAMQERLDDLESAATKAIMQTYGPIIDYEARFWLQKGIEGMRYAVATEGEPDA